MPQQMSGPAGNILVVEDTDSLREILCTVLRCEGYNVIGEASAETALERLKTEEFSLVLSDLKLPGKSGLDFIRDSSAYVKNLPIVVMTAYGSINIAVEAMKLGAVDFITKPFDPPALVALLQKIISAKHEVKVSVGGPKDRIKQFLTQSPKVEEMLSQARKVAPLTSPVILLGESGTGKELVARYIHDQSPRANQQFVPVNCASMPSELLESEFFGHEAGAFTGATEDRIGLFEAANNSTIFLDEIGNMPLELQIKLLRTLQESEIKKLGSSKIQKVDVRVISATNCDLESEIAKGKFRLDLFYRLGVVAIEIPPLRERPEDIELLANYFLKVYSDDSRLTEKQRKERVLTGDALKALHNYRWPGNVRELENVIERAVIFSQGPITADALHFSQEQSESADGSRSLAELSANATKKAEMEAIKRVLAETHGNKSKAAKLLGVSYKTLLNKVKEYEVEAVSNLTPNPQR